MNLSDELKGKIPERIVKRLEALETDLQAVLSKAAEELVTQLPGPLSFRYEHSAPSDILTVEERAQSVSFTTRYENLPTEFSVQLVQQGERWYIGNLPFLRHALNDFRPIIQNQSDAVFYRKIHQVWYQMLLRTSSKEGMTIRALDNQDRDVTPIFARWVGERQRAIGIVLGALEYDYLYNGILQHSYVRFSQRFLKDYVSGELNYLFWKHVDALGFIRDMLVPYYTLINVVTFPKLGAL